MLEVAGRLILGGVLAGASLAKLAAPGRSRAALSSFGIVDRRAQGVAFPFLIATELALAIGVIAGFELAAWLAAMLMAMFALTMIGAILSGHAGAPCACFGARSTVSWPAVARNALLAGAFAALTSLPSRNLSTDEWLGIGLVAALLGCVGLAVVVMALAREVGMLRLRIGPEGALEIAEEGPQLGSRTSVVGRFEFEPEASLALAVFVSDGCHVCRSLEPSISTLANDPMVAVQRFEEEVETAVWSELEIPGSPFAVALDREGTVLAKGTFNNLVQLESVLGAAERRAAERAMATSAGVHV